jgi:transcription initiation factor TFIIB
MNKWQRQLSLTNSQKGLANHFNELRSLGNLYHAPRPVVNDATNILRKVNNEGLAYNRSPRVCAAASLYIAAQINEIPVASYKELSTSKEYTVRAFGSACKTFKIGLKIPTLITPPSNYVPKICSDLDLSDKIQNKSCEILEEIERRGEECQLPNTNRSLAAAIIYTTGIILNEKRNQKDVARVSGITEVTLRKTYRNIIDRLNIDIYV